MRFGLVKNDVLGSDLDFFRRNISNIFDEFFDLTPTDFFEYNWIPAIDMEEDEKRVYVKAELPGIDEKDLNVSFEGNILTIMGEKKSENEKKEKDKKYIVSERRYGSFSRSIKLPDGIRVDEIKAGFKNGVLNITIPKDKLESNKKINININ